MDEGTVGLSDFNGFKAADETRGREGNGFEEIAAGADAADAGQVWSEGSAEVTGLVAEGTGSGGALENDFAPLRVAGWKRFLQFIEPGTPDVPLRGEGLAGSCELIPDDSGGCREAFIDGSRRKRREGSGIAQGMKQSDGPAFVRDAGEGFQEDRTEQE